MLKTGVPASSVCRVRVTGPADGRHGSISSRLPGYSNSLSCFLKKA